MQYDSQYSFLLLEVLTSVPPHRRGTTLKWLTGSEDPADSVF